MPHSWIIAKHNPLFNVRAWTRTAITTLNVNSVTHSTTKLIDEAAHVDSVCNGAANMRGAFSGIRIENVVGGDTPLDERQLPRQVQCITHS